SWSISSPAKARPAPSENCAPVLASEGPMSALNDYLARSAAAITAMAERDLSAEMERAVAAVVEALRHGKALLICGNGGSASDAIHIAGELVGRFLKERKAYNV